MKCMELSLEDWFPILPRSWLHLYSMPVALWPLVLLWCGRQKHKPGWGREREGWGIAKGETVYNGRGGAGNVGGGGRDFFLGWRARGGGRGGKKRPVRVLQGSGREREPMKPSSDRAVRVCTEGGLVVGGQERKPGPGKKGDRVMVGGWERAWRWRELIETSAPLQ